MQGLAILSNRPRLTKLIPQRERLRLLLRWQLKPGKSLDSNLECHFCITSFTRFQSRPWSAWETPVPAGSCWKKVSAIMEKTVVQPSPGQQISPKEHLLRMDPHIRHWHGRCRFWRPSESQEPVLSLRSVRSFRYSDAERKQILHKVQYKNDKRFYTMVSKGT